MAGCKGKTVIIGTGRIGSLCAWSLAMGGVGQELVLVDANQPKVQAQVTDLCDAATEWNDAVKIQRGTYDACADADVALICVGTQPPRKGEARQKVLSETAAELADVAENLVQVHFSGVCILVCYPNDLMTRYFQELTGFPVQRVMGAQALLYTLRLKRLLSEYFNVDQNEVEVFAMGECGESQAVAWSAATVKGVPLLKLMEQYPDTYGRIDLSALADKVRHMGWVIQEGKGREEFGVSCAACIIAQAVLEGDGQVLPVTTYLDGVYGQHGLYAAAPARLGHNGVEQVLEVPLNVGEQAEFTASCRALQELYSEMTVPTVPINV